MHSKRIQNENDSANIIANNQDLITQILVRLPIKSLLRFKCGPKHWLSLISNPDFSRRLNRSLTVSALFIRIYSSLRKPEYELVPLGHNFCISNPQVQSFTFVEDPHGIRILQSCNGLLLCCSHNADVPRKNYYVYNPINKKFATLPKTGGPNFKRVYGVVLAFDPLKSSHYKVICVRRCRSRRNKSQFVIDVFSSENPSWRLCANETPFEENEYVNFKLGVFCNGVIYWKSGTRNTLLCFKLEVEQVEKLSGPENGDNGSFMIQYIGASQGNFHVFGSVGKNDKDYTEYKIYEMENDQSGWKIKYRFDFDAVAISYPEMKYSFSTRPSDWCYAFRVFCIVVAEKDEDSFMVLHITGKLIRYNLNDKSFQLLHNFDPNIYPYQYHNGTFLFIDSDDAHGFIRV